MVKHIVRHPQLVLMVQLCGFIDLTDYWLTVLIIAPAKSDV